MDTNEFVKYTVGFKHYKYSTICSNLINYLVIKGRGDYGTVFQLSDGRVAKVYKSHDVAYQAFLDMSYVSKNIHLPNINCNAVFSYFGFVVLEFVDGVAANKYMHDNFKELTNGMTNIILDKQEQTIIPATLRDLAEEMKEAAQGFCLDFRKPNFGVNDGIFKVLDPFALKTKDNNNLVYIEKPKVIKPKRK